MPATYGLSGRGTRGEHPASQAWRRMSPIVVGRWNGQRQRLRTEPLRAAPHELVDSQARVPGDAAKQVRGQVTARMHWHGRCAPVRMTEPLVQAALTNFLEAQRGEDGDNLARLEYRDRRHPRSHHDGLRADILANHRGRSVFEDHGDDFAEIGVELIERLALAVGAGKAGDIPDVKASLPATLDNRGIRCPSLPWTGPIERLL